MRAAVIGGGIVGLFAAHYLDRSGLEVVVVDRGPVGSGCSAGNAGWICPSISFPLPAPGLTTSSLRWVLHPDSPLFIRPGALPRLTPFLLRFRHFCNRQAFERGVEALSALSERTLELFAELESQGLAFEHRRDGLLMVFRSGAPLEHELELLRLSGYESKITIFSSSELEVLEPALAPDTAGGILARPEWHVRPETLCSALSASLRGRGVEVLEETEARSFHSERGRVVALETAQGTLEADVYIVATGAEGDRLSRQVGTRLHLQAGKGYSITIESPRARVRHPLYFPESKAAVTPFEGSHRVAGTMELSGINMDMDRRRLTNLEASAEREVPGVLEGDGRQVWVGMRPLTPDGLPYIGRLPTRENVFVATGHQMLGMTLAPPTGRALADLIVGGASEIELRPFDPGRFN